MRGGAGVLTILAIIAAFPAALAAQERQCTLSTAGRAESTGDQIVVLHDPFDVLCEDGARLRANSGRLDQTTRELFLNGDVHFEDAERTLTSREATYNSVAGRLFAQGDVVFVNRVEGSTLRGPELEYFRSTEERPLAQVIATGRPTLTIEPEDPGAEDGEPLIVVADRFLIVGDDDLSAFDSVVVTRSDLQATSAEARYNSTTEDLELRRDAVVVYEGYRLSGEVVQADLAEGSLQHVHARTDARLEGEEMRVEAPDLQLFFAADTLRRAVAVAPEGGDTTRAVARSDDFEVRGDSIDASFVGQEIREVYAIGEARAETRDTAAAAPGPIEPDTTAPVPAAAPPLLGSDWIRGDTVIAYFEPSPPDSGAVAAVDTTAAGAPPVDAAQVGGEVELRRLIAIGSAQSLYRIAPEGEPESPRRNVNFLVGARIELDLTGNELSVASVSGLERGIYLEATDDTAPPIETPTPPEPGPAGTDAPNPGLG